jgi:hypothetical protein
MSVDPFRKPEAKPRLAYREGELAAALGVSVRTLNEWRHSQGLPFVTINKRPLYLADSVTAWLKAREVRQTPTTSAQAAHDGQ